MSEKPKVLRVVGMTFLSGYPHNLLRLHDALEQYKPVDGARDSDESFPVVLVRRPDNPHDPNAVEVHIPSLGDRVGHLSRQHAKALAPLLDDKESPYRLNAWVYQVRLDPEHPTNPGLDIAVVRQPVESGLF